MTAFRRAFVRRHPPPARVCVEAEGQAWALPNDAGRYEADEMLRRVAARGEVDLSRWERISDPGCPEEGRG